MTKKPQMTGLGIDFDRLEKELEKMGTIRTKTRLYTHEGIINSRDTL